MIYHPRCWSLLAALLLGLAACTSNPPANAPAPPAAAPTAPAALAAPTTATPPSQPPTQSAAPTPVALDLAIVSVAGWYAPAYLMTDRGLLAEEGIKGDWVSAGIAEAVRSVVSGSVPLGLLGSDPSLVAASKGAPIHEIAAYFQQPVYDVMGAPNVRRVADLRGQQVAVAQTAGATTHLVRLFLEANGLQPSDYDLIVGGGNPERLAAVQSGVAAAAVVSDPANFVALEQGFNSLGNITSVVPEYDFSAWWGYQPWLQEHPNLAVRFLKAQLRARRWLNDPAHRADFLAVIQDRLKVSPDIAEKVYLYYTRDLPDAIAPDLRLNERATARTIEVAGATDEITRPYPAPTQFFEPSYLDRATRELGT
jgi:ABC-type nitrate/sulfonate/bicarbonate transport system substrate-binding protein